MSAGRYLVAACDLTGLPYKYRAVRGGETVWYDDPVDADLYTKESAKLVCDDFNEYWASAGIMMKARYIWRRDEM